MCGILHDIGKLILIEYFPDRFSEALELAESEDLTIAEAEEQILGVTHADIGGWLAEKWNLPQSLVETIAYHHNPSDLENPEELLLLVHLANALVRHLGIGNSGDSRPARLDPMVAGMFKGGEDLSDEALLDRLSDGFDAELDKAQVFGDLGE